MGSSRLESSEPSQDLPEVLHGTSAESGNIWLKADSTQEWIFTSDLNLLFVFCIRNYSHFILD